MFAFRIFYGGEGRYRITRRTGLTLERGFWINL